mmetsp:Transcript_77536/g.185969  ORF Transcript_77536/g.185969 Transcript_77536/m.185969 type:complete len:618 (-) Transcript_77536:90-1943(-)
MRFRWVALGAFSVCAAPSVNLQEPLSLGTCICDLTQGQCDINCCCDPDCDSLGTLKDSFNCLPEGPRDAVSERYCYSKSWLHSVNPRVDLWVITDDLRGLLCVSVDNSAVQGEVFQNEALLSSAQIDAIIQAQAEQRSTQAQDVALRSYLAGDLLKAHYALSPGQGVQPVQGAATLENTAFVEVVDYLLLPTADPLGNCAAGQGIRFLNAVPSAGCWKRNLDLTSACASLSPRLLLGTWMLRSQHMPEDMRCGSRCILPTTCLVQRVAADGSVTALASCDTPPVSTFQQSAGSCTCANALHSAHYSFSFGFDEASQVVRITKAEVNFSIQDLESPGCGLVDVPQEGSVSFVQDATSQPEARSGNPGYVVGLPLLVTDCLTTEAGSCTQYGQRRDASLPGILPGGGCQLTSANASTREVKINFGEDAIFGCSLSLTREELAALCGGLPNGFAGYLEMLPLGRWAYLAAFGSVPLGAQDAADFVEVEQRPRTEALQFSDSTAQQASNSTCTGAVVGVDLEVIYSPFGEVSNPQFKIVGARASQRLGVLSYQLDSPRQPFQFTYTVTFLQTGSENLETKVPPRPQLPLSLPPDLFYPFTIGAAPRMGPWLLPWLALAVAM